MTTELRRRTILAGSSFRYLRAADHKIVKAQLFSSVEAAIEPATRSRPLVGNG